MSQTHHRRGETRSPARSRRGGARSSAEAPRGLIALQQAAGNRAVTDLVMGSRGVPRALAASVQRAPRRNSALDREVCRVGDEPTPHDLADAIRRREITPGFPGFLSHHGFGLYLSRLERAGEINRPLAARLSSWSHGLAMRRQARRRESVERNRNGPRIDRPPRPDYRVWRGGRPGEAMKAFVVGGATYVVDVGRGVVHLGRYVIAAGDPDELKRLAREDVAFLGMAYNAFRHPVRTATRIGTGYAAAVAAQRYLTPQQQEEVAAAASSVLPEVVQKQLGKRVARTIVLSALVQPLLRRAAGAITNQLAKKVVTRAGGPVLGALGVLGMMDKSGQASRRLKARYPMLHDYLEPQHLQMAWFLVEEPLEQVRTQLERQLAQALR